MYNIHIYMYIYNIYTHAQYTDTISVSVSVSKISEFSRQTIDFDTLLESNVGKHRFCVDGACVYILYMCIFAKFV